MSHRPAKYMVGEFFTQKEKKKLFKIVHAEWQGIITKPSTSKVKEHTREINDWLYDIEYVDPTVLPRYGRYYENRISEECEQVISDLPKVIYE